eukprot:UN32762
MDECPTEYDELRVCQCNDECEEYGNCCPDVDFCRAEQCDNDISDNHGHIFTLPESVCALPLEEYHMDIQGTSRHPHSLVITAEDIERLRLGETVAIESGEEREHTHLVTITCDYGCPKDWHFVTSFHYSDEECKIPIDTEDKPYMEVEAEDNFDECYVSLLEQQNVIITCVEDQFVQYTYYSDDMCTDENVAVPIRNGECMPDPRLGDGFTL